MSTTTTTTQAFLMPSPSANSIIRQRHMVSIQDIENINGEETVSFLKNEFELDMPLPTTAIDQEEEQEIDDGIDDETRIIEEMNHQFRFGGVERLYSAHTGQAVEESDLLDRLMDSTVVVVGLGGVGSWAAEALCRSGIGHLVLVDLDDVCMSNTNRQMHTMTSTVGKFKIDVLAERFRDLHPLCRVTCVHDFVSVDNVDDILKQIRTKTQKALGANHDVTAVLDAIDGAKEKSAMLAACARARLPVVTCGGAAGLTDPTRIVCEDLARVKDDKLLSACRRHMRKHYGFPAGKGFHEKGLSKKWRLSAVHSTEPVPILPKDSSLLMSSSSSQNQQCDGVMGTACFVTGSFGFAAASQIITGIAENKLKPPLRVTLHP